MQAATGSAPDAHPTWRQNPWLSVCHWHLKWHAAQPHRIQTFDKLAKPCTGSPVRAAQGFSGSQLETCY